MKKISPKLLIFPLCQILSLAIIFITIFNQHSKILQFTAMACFFIFILSSIYLISFIKGSIQSVYLETENKYLLLQSHYNKKHFTAIKEKQQKTKEIQAAFQKTLLNISAHLEEGDPQKALMHIDSIGDKFCTSSISFCNHPILDAILSEKVASAQSAGIAVNCHVNPPETLLIDSVALICVASNLLDNAREACNKMIITRTNETDIGKIDNIPYINITIDHHCGYFIMKVENSKLPIIHNLSTTSKEDTENHGFGLTILRDTAKKYHGNVSFTDNGTSFTAIVSLENQTTTLDN